MLCLAAQTLQSQLDSALEAGDVSGSGALAQQIAAFKAQLRAQKQQAAEGRQREREEREWETAQLAKINAIKAVVEERRRETEAVQRSVRQQLTGQLQQRTSNGSGHGGSSTNNNSGGSGSGSAASFFSSVFSSSSHSHSKDSASRASVPPSAAASSNTQPAGSLDALLQQARKSIKTTQVVLEKQTLIVDSVDMNEHPSTLHAAPVSSPSLQSIKAIRKDTVQLIQSHLSHVDELERHIDTLDRCLAFLDLHLAPPIQRPATSATATPSAQGSGGRRQQQQQQSSRNGPMR